MTTGIVKPPLSAVFALNSLQNCIMLTPCCPKAGPTGGAGVALPAVICNLMRPVTFFAMFSPPVNQTQFKVLQFFNLDKIQFNRRFSSKHVNKNLECLLVHVYFLDQTHEILEWSGYNFDFFPNTDV